MVLYCAMGHTEIPETTRCQSWKREEDNAGILAAVERRPGIASRGDIERAPLLGLTSRMLEIRLRNLANEGLLITEGSGRALKYRLPKEGAPQQPAHIEAAQEGFRVVPHSCAAANAVRRIVSRPVAARRPVSYKRSSLPRLRWHRSSSPANCSNSSCGNGVVWQCTCTNGEGAGKGRYQAVGDVDSRAFSRYPRIRSPSEPSIGRRFTSPKQRFARLKPAF